MDNIDQDFLDEVAKRHNKDYPPEYWKNGGKQDAICTEHGRKGCEHEFKAK